MQGKGQLLVSTLLLFLFNVFAQNAGAHARGRSDSDAAGVASSSPASPAVGKSSNSAAAFSIPAAGNEGLDARQTNLSPSFATGDADAPPLLRNGTNKQPIYRPSSSRAQSSSPGLGNLGLKDDRNVDSEKQAERDHGHYHRHFRRGRRGGYNVPYFVGKRVLDDMTDVAQDFEKRSGLDKSLLNTLQDQQLLLSASRQAGFSMGTDKRYTPLFVGKRSAELPLHEQHRVRRQAYGAPYFVGKRTLEESEDLEQEELQKRSIPNDSPADNLEDLQDFAILDLNEETPSDVPDKRHAPLFIGKRRAPFFIGKRWVPYFVGRRQAPYFIGKRTDLTASRRAAPFFVGRRRYAPLFIGKRHAPMFVGKRASAPLFIGKRRAPMFVGKRPTKDWSELLSALHTLQAARHYRRMIQADKRHNAPFFVGRRSAPQEEAGVTDNAPEVKGDYFR